MLHWFSRLAEGFRSWRVRFHNGTIFNGLVLAISPGDVVVQSTDGNGGHSRMDVRYCQDIVSILMG